MVTVIRARRGTARKTVKAEEIQIPDCWHAYEYLLDMNKPAYAEAVVECWHLCEDLLEHILDPEEKRG